jgi:transposase-like protein
MTTVGHPPRLLHGHAATNERLVREAIARNVIITQGKTRLDVKCNKCGAANRLSAEVDHGRVEYACKECGHNQKTL